ncbi:LexA family protein [Pseudomonas aeruginosa]|uniref:LexA family protein n=1 Tax=Pseudomonas aeruginosa TaxID=287 RepID=UPI0004F34C7E|nr:LexA family transcriptional regulator [Pseudomonas aeruginosa]EIU2707758.1 helix-turn-helix domain-containing protein [Pseudomonas aeruginosa]ELH1108568.1 helix-turn-helix domain-containing protein [Pseudomonas aeruginosa]ELU0706281.1 helix-turn-helix domain-containing protein [Pseudomonas aeruginosa]HDQ4472058.1 helix-turn-helix domain-containing protein [Pseudomonas aeruginosa]
MKKKPLPPEKQAECAALKAIYQQKRHELGLTQEGIARRLGITQGSLSHYLNGRNALNAEFAVKIAELLQVAVGSFSPRLEEEITRMIMALPAKGRRQEREASNVTLALQPHRSPLRYPVISWVAAGERAESPDLHPPGVADEWLPSTENAGANGYWLIILGDSMSSPTPPSFPPGTPILVQPEGFDLISGKYYVAKHSDGETTFKQYVYDAGVKYLVPLNKAYRTLEMDDDWEIIGRVIDAKVPGL